MKKPDIIMGWGTTADHGDQEMMQATQEVFADADNCFSDKSRYYILEACDLVGIYVPVYHGKYACRRVKALSDLGYKPIRKQLHNMLWNTIIEEHSWE